jgi:hypothetical protein
MAEIADVEVKVTYTLQLLREYLEKCPATEVKGTLDGENISGRYLLFEALLTQFIGPNLPLAPNILLDDGLFDVVMVSTAQSGTAPGDLREGAMACRVQDSAGARPRSVERIPGSHRRQSLAARGEEPKPAGAVAGDRAEGARVSRAEGSTGAHAATVSSDNEDQGGTDERSLYQSHHSTRCRSRCCSCSWVCLT